MAAKPMTKNRPPQMEDRQEEIGALVRQFHETYRRLEELTGGQLDAVIHAKEPSYLLRVVRENLRNSETAERDLLTAQSLILNAVPAQIALVDQEGVIVLVNDGWRKFAEANALEDPSFGVGRKYLEVCEQAQGLDPQEARRAATGMKAVLAGTTRQFTLDYPCHSPDEKRWFRLIIGSMKEAGPAGAVIMQLNITEQKLAEEALQESEERFRGTFEQAAVGIAHVSTSGHFLRVNDKLCDIIGYNRDELLSLSIAGITHPEDRFEGIQARRAMLAGEKVSYTIEKRCRRKDGEILWVNLVTTLDRPAVGSPKYFIAVFSDITVRKQVEEKIEQRRTLLTMASRVGHLGAWALDLSSFELNWSEEICEIHEIPAECTPTVAESIRFYAPEYRDTIRESMRSCIQDGLPFDVELQIITAQGRRLWTRTIGEAARDATGAIVRVQGAFQDITTRKKEEQELARINRALKMLSTCNEVLVRAENELELLDKICRIVVENGGYRMAWVGFSQENGARSITPMAHAGVEEGFLSEVQMTWNEHEVYGQGPEGESIRSGRAIMCDDLALDTKFEHLHASAERCGYRSVICLPLRAGDHTFGLLGLYSAETNPASADEIQLLQEMANDLAFGIVNLRARVEQRRLQDVVLKVAASVSGGSGADFFTHLVSNMVEALGAQAGAVAQPLEGQPERAQTLAVIVNGEVLENFDYTIAGTPCGKLQTCEVCVIEKAVAGQLSALPALAALGPQGYVGRRIESSTGQPLGQISVVFQEPLKNVEFISSTLQIFAARAASELERRETDVQMREQAALLDIAHEAIHVEDLDGRVIYWNKGAESMYGWSAAEVIGRKSGEILQEDETTLAIAQVAMETAGEWQGEMTRRTRDERQIVVEVGWTLVRDADGRPKSVLVIDTDVTERKKLEEQAFRTQRMESVGTLASGLAHDLDNILAPILMCAPLLRHENTLEQRDVFITTIEASASRGAQIINQVLTFGRGVEGERRIFQIAEVVEEVMQIARETFPKNIHLDYQTAGDLSEIVGDVTQWHQVLLNLAINARDAMPNGGVLRITAENLEVDEHYASMISDLTVGPHIVLDVTDTGSGISPKIADRIFDPFFTTKPVGKGTGLGLSSVLGIVKSHGAVIKLISELGVGTTFRIFIPASGVPEGMLMALGTDEPASGNGEMVLIVDDEENVRKATAAMLEMRGYKTLLAGDGTEALAVFAQHFEAVDVLLTDITMPFLDGVGLIRALQRMKPGLPIIVSTGQAESARLAELKDLGVQSALKKPYTVKLLLQTIQAALKVAGE